MDHRQKIHTAARRLVATGQERRWSEGVGLALPDEGWWWTCTLATLDWLAREGWPGSTRPIVAEGDEIETALDFAGLHVPDAERPAPEAFARWVAAAPGTPAVRAILLSAVADAERWWREEAVPLGGYTIEDFFQKAMHSAAYEACCLVIDRLAE